MDRRINVSGFSLGYSEATATLHRNSFFFNRPMIGNSSRTKSARNPNWDPGRCGEDGIVIHLFGERDTAAKHHRHQTEDEQQVDRQAGDKRRFRGRGELVSA